NSIYRAPTRRDIGRALSSTSQQLHPQPLVSAFPLSAFIRSAPSSLSAARAALPCMSLTPLAPFSFSPQLLNPSTSQLPYFRFPFSALSSPLNFFHPPPD